MTYRAGEWKVVCDRCGFDYRNVDLTLEWTGLRVCRECLDHRHPQETIIAREDRQAPPWVRPGVTPNDDVIILTETSEGLLTEDSDELAEE